MANTEKQATIVEDYRMQNEIFREQVDSDMATARAAGPDASARLQYRLLDEFGDGGLDAHEVRKASRDDRANVLAVAEAKNKAQSVRKSVVRLVEAIKNRFIPNINPQNQEFFDQLADENLDDTEAAFIHQLIQHAINPQAGGVQRYEIKFSGLGDPETPFEVDLKKMRKENKGAFEKVMKVVKRPTVKATLYPDAAIVEEKIKMIEQRDEYQPTQAEQRLDPDQKQLNDYIQKLSEGFNPNNTRERLQEQLVRRYLLMGKNSTTLGNIINPDNPDQTITDPDEFERRAKEQMNRVLGDSATSELVTLANNIRDDSNHERLARMQGMTPDLLRKIEDMTESKVFNMLFRYDPIEKKYVWDDNNQGDTFSKSAREVVNLLFEKIDLNPTADFRDVFNDLVEGQALRAIINRFEIYKNSEHIAEKLGGKDTKEFKQFQTFIEQKIVQEMNFEKNHRELYHNIQWVLKNLPPDKWPSALSRTNLSEFSMMTQDDVVNIGIREFKNYVQDRIIRNKNNTPAHLLGGEMKTSDKFYERYYTFPDRDNFKALLHKKLTELGIKHENWELDRAYSFAQGITSFTLELPAIIANSNPLENMDFSTLPMAPAVEALNTYQRFGAGRAGKGLIKEGAVWMAMVFPKEEMKKNIMQHMKDGVKNRWIPEDLDTQMKAWYDKNFENMTDEEYKETLYQAFDTLDFGDIDRGNTFGKILRKLTLGGLFDRHGWRVRDSIAKVYDEDANNVAAKKKWGEIPWEEKMEWMRVNTGVLTELFISEDWAESEANDLISRTLFGKSPGELGSHEKGEMKEFQIRGEEREAREIKITRAGKHEEISYTDFKDKREDILRGRTFYHLLLRDPQAFLNNTIQMFPQGAFEGHKKLIGGDEVKAVEFYFGNWKEADSHHPPSTDQGYLSSKDYEEWERFRRYFYPRYGMPNAEHAKKLMNFYTNLFEKFPNDNIPPGEPVTFNKKKARDALYERLGIAYEKARRDKRPEITPQDIISDADFAANPDSQGAIIRRLMFDRDGLIPYFKNVVVGDEHRTFGDGQMKIGGNMGDDKNFFSRMAYTYYKKDFLGNVLPNGDLDHRLMFMKAGQNGEDAMVRTIGDIAPFKEIQLQVAELYRKLKKVSRFSYDTPVLTALKPLLELHSSMKDLEPIFDKTFMREMQYYVATVGARYFQEHYATRLPFPFSAVAKMGIGMDKISLSKMRYGATAFSMNNDAIKEYIHWLDKEGCLEGEGPRSAEQLEKELGVSMPKWATTELVPGIALPLIMFVLMQWIQKAMSEAEGKK